MSFLLRLHKARGRGAGVPRLKRQARWAVLTLALLLLGVGLFHWFQGEIRAFSGPALRPSPLWERLDLRAYVETLEDPAGEMELGDLLHPAQADRFEKHPDDEPLNFSYTDSAYWLRFFLEEPVGENRWLLEVGYPLLDRVEFFAPAAEGGYTQRVTGNALPFDTRPFEHRNFAFELPPEWDPDRPFLIRVETDKAMILPLSLWQADSFGGYTQSTYLLFGLYYGLLLLISCYALFLFFFSREPDYLLYAAFILSAALFLATYNGLAFQYLWPDHPWWSQRAINFFLFLASACGFAFTRRVLPMRRDVPVLDRLLWWLAVLAALMVPLTLVVDVTRAMQLAIATVLAGPLIILPLSLLYWRREIRRGAYLFWGWMLLVAGVLVMSFRSLAWVADTWWTEYSVQLSLLPMGLLLLLGLAEHMDKLQRERERMQLDLEQRRQEVQRAQSAFLFAQMKPHFLFNALNTVAYFTRVDPRKARDLLGDLSTYLRKSFDFKEIPRLVPLEDELELTRAYVNIERARFGRHLEVDFQVDAPDDTPVLPFSIQPLVENALVHGLRGKRHGVGRVTVSCNQAPEGIRVVVEDNGKGIRPQDIETLFEPRAEGGVGLWNIHNRLQSVYGSGLRVESRRGERTRVEFTMGEMEHGQDFPG